MYCSREEQLLLALHGPQTLKKDSTCVVTRDMAAGTKIWVKKTLLVEVLDIGKEWTEVKQTKLLIFLLINEILQRGAQFSIISLFPAWGEIKAGFTCGAMHDHKEVLQDGLTYYRPITKDLSPTLNLKVQCIWNSNFGPSLVITDSISLVYFSFGCRCFLDGIMNCTFKKKSVLPSRGCWFLKLFNLFFFFLTSLLTVYMALHFVTLPNKLVSLEEQPWDAYPSKKKSQRETLFLWHQTELGQKGNFLKGSGQEERRYVIQTVVPWNILLEDLTVTGSEECASK